jgi:hypothetical protein
VNVGFPRTLLHWEITYCLFLNCKHTKYSAKMIITLQSTDMPHVTWKEESNSGKKPAAFNFKAQKKCRQFTSTCHSQGLKVRPVDVEAHSTISSISHVTLQNLTQFICLLLNYNAAFENHQQLSPLGNMTHTSSGCS